MTQERLATGIAGLDARLGGGFLPGTMTVLVGASGIGKTQFGLSYLNAGLEQEGRRGFIVDLTARGDSQNHEDYASRLFNWSLKEQALSGQFDPASVFDPNRELGDYFPALSRQGRRVTRRDLDFDQWLDWKSDLTRHLDSTIDFLFSQFIRGTRRFIIDGIEPVSRQGDSIQFELLEYLYHQIVQKEPEWVARDLFRQFYRSWADTIAERLYPPHAVGCLVLYTTSETSLDSMIEKPLEEGDLLAAANTIIYMGKIREGTRFRRGLYVSKHRGSVCPDEIMFYDINEHGLFLN
ncbi:MAG: RAD55 family ATPase [Planctomycetia bacterium]|nr:RAD55 family ATPase [Planctomycetia bacterium]